MANRDVVVTVDTSRLNRLMRNFPGNVDEAVRTIAFAIEGKAKVRAPIDTGALRASIYTRTSKSNGRDPAWTEARAKNSKVTLSDLPQPGEHEAVVGPSVNYAIDVELGTSRRAATPYLVPAVRETESEMATQLRHAVNESL